MSHLIARFPLPAAVLAGCCLLAAAPVGFAQSTPSAAPPQQKLLEDIEKQLQSLKTSVEELKKAPVTNAAPPATTAPVTPVSRTVNTNDPIARIRDEGMNRSQVMDTLSYLTEVIGPRLTGSPNMKRANEWTRTKLAEYGLTNAHLEPWGPFGKGWSLKRFSAQITEPQGIPLIGYPAAWSPGFEKPIEAKVVYFDATSDDDLEKFKGKLKGAVVLASPIREVTPHFDPQGTRLDDAGLLSLANADQPRPGSSTFTPGMMGTPPGGARRGGPVTAIGGTNTVGRAGGPGRRGGPGGARFLSFLAKEGAAVIVNPSSQGDGGTIFVMSATVPPPDISAPGTNSMRGSTNRIRGGASTNRVAIAAGNTSTNAGTNAT